MRFSQSRYILRWPVLPPQSNQPAATAVTAVLVMLLLTVTVTMVATEIAAARLDALSPMKVGETQMPQPCWPVAMLPSMLP